MKQNAVSAFENARLLKLSEQLNNSNRVSEKYGLSLSAAQITALIQAEKQSLRDCGRLEFGNGILPRLIYAFCDSPYITRDEYYDIISALEELFYQFKNDLNDALSDDELIDAMHRIYHGRAQGSLEYLENMATDRLIQALRSDIVEEEEEDD